VRYSFLVRLSHPLLHAGLSRRILDHLIRPRPHIWWNRQTERIQGDGNCSSHVISPEQKPT
ncbi:MAG: hypothetical protein ACM37Z_15650, partial [Deltaproteobacteria bacterium]